MTSPSVMAGPPLVNDMDWTAVLVATVGATGLVASAAVGNFHAKKIKKSLGTANGRGDAIKMLTDLQDDVKMVRLQQQDIIRWQVDHLNHHIDRS